MPDNPTTPEATPAAETPTTEQPKPAAPTEPDTGGKDWQAEAEKWKAFARKHEDTAKANADKARQFDALEESQKSEMQKAAERTAAAEAEAATSRGELAVMRAAVKFGLSADDLDLLGTHGTPEEIEARAEKLAARLKTAAAAVEAAKPPIDFGGGDRGKDVNGRPDYASQIAAATADRNFPLAIALKEQQHANKS